MAEEIATDATPVESAPAEGAEPVDGNTEAVGNPAEQGEAPEEGTDEGSPFDDGEGLGAAPAEGDELPPADGYVYDNLDAGDGLDIDKPTADAFAAVAKEVGLSQANFEKVYSKTMSFLNERQGQQMAGMRHEFLTQARADKEIGGANYKSAMSTARKAFTKFVDADTMEILHASGLDCHPGVIRAFYNIGKLISDDAVVRGSPAQRQNPAKAFFNNSNMN